MSSIKKFFKTLAYIIGSIILLLLIVVLAIQIPPVQNFIVQKATNYVSSKTHTKVEIKKVGISFPKSIFIDGLFLEDLSKDTLLYAGEIIVNLDMIGLIKGDIHFKNVELKKIATNISRSPNDSLFNFDFMIKTFGDSAATKEIDTPTAEPINLIVDRVQLQSIRLKYDDQFTGTYSSIDLAQLNLKMNGLDFDSLKFDIDELTVEGLQGIVTISKHSNVPTSPASILPTILANKLNIKSSAFAFTDEVDKSKFSAGINQLLLEDAAMDLNEENILLKKILLDNSVISINITESIKVDSVLLNEVVSGSNWKVSVQEIAFANNKIGYNILNLPTIKNSFDANHLNYQKLNLQARDLYYSNELTKAEIQLFSVKNINGIEVKEFSTLFKMNSSSINLTNLKLSTANSKVDATIDLKYSSLKSLKDSLQHLFVNASITNTMISVKDILYFSPQLSVNPFLNDARNIAAFSGKIVGKINDLKGQEITLTTASKTSLKTDFHITGLPDAERAYFDLPNIKITTGRNDLRLLMGEKLIPNTISFPSNINVNAKFKGKIKAFQASMDLSTEYGKLKAIGNIDKQENFKANIDILNFNAGLLLKNTTTFGPATMQVAIDGKGLSKNTIQAMINVDAPSIYLNKYSYRNLKVNGSITAEQFDGKISLNDSNVVLDFTGLVNITPGKEHYKFALNLQGADLKNLHLTTDDLRISADAVADLKGKDLNTISGTAGVTKIVLAKHGVKYKLDSLMFVSINEKRRSELNISSAIIGIKYNGTFAPGSLVTEIKQHVNRYFPITDKTEVKKQDKDSQNFSFEIQLHNHPIISEFFLPKLTEFEPGLITGKFNSENNELIFNAGMKKVVYAGTAISNLSLKINSDNQKINYALTTDNFSTPQLNLTNFIADGSLQNQNALLNISSIDEAGNKKLLIKTTTTKTENGINVYINPDEFFLGNKQWNLPVDNYIAFNDQGFLIHNVFLTQAERQIKIASVNNKFNDDISVTLKEFELNDISRIIEKDTSLVEGNLSADLLLKKVKNNYGIIASAELKNLTIKKVQVGTLTLKAENPTTEKFVIEAKLKGGDNNISATGYFIPKDSANALNIQVDINNLAIKTVEAFSMNQVSEGSGSMKGKFSIKGNSKTPIINGNVIFTEAYLKPTALNNRLYFKNEKIEINPSGIYFNDFTIVDENGHDAQINGAVTMKEFSNLGFALNINTKDFLVFNTTQKDNKVYYGRMIIDSRINIKGTPDFPVVDSKVKLKKGSSFTFAVPEKKLTTDRGEDVVVFVDSLKFHPIITRNEEIEKQKSGLKGYNISSNIEVDNEATLRLLIDPATNDSLVVRGDAALSFSLDPSGKISLTGAYSLTDGSYIVSLQSLIKKRFTIESGSTIVWNGDPLDADVNINAIYTIRTAPIDLVADQISGLSDADKNTYRQRLPFLVFLKMRGALLKPDISFEIQLPPEDKGALNGSVNAKLNQLNEDPSSLNKQVFALLVLRRFIQENPLESAGGASASTLARNSVSSFLSAQLNQLGSKVLPGVELNFNVQSYDDYTSGAAEGRTQVEVGLKKELFNDKLIVQVGGTVDVEGEKAGQNNASDITGDVSVEYKLTDDGRYRLKGFRQNQYEGALEGQLVETGAGILYTRDYDRWKEFFKRPEKKTKEKDDKSK